MPHGYLSVSVKTADGSIPIENAKVYIRTSGFRRNQDASEDFSSDADVSNTYFNYILTTNSSGSTQAIKIETPQLQSSLNENSTQIPYAVADVYVDAAGYFPTRIRHVQIFADTLSVLPVSLVPLASDYSGAEGGVINYNVPPNQLLIPDLRQPQGPASSTAASPFITSEVYIPANVTVHLGSPSSNVENVTVPFIEYIKNVASSEIYPTWPESSLRANIYAIISLTLNRIFTEWYPSQGYDFDITSSTGYDQAFVPGRNIYENIGRIVDEIFNSYVARIGTINPLFTSFCDGKRVQCDGMSQWGTVDLAEQGYTPIQILRHYYGDDIEIVTTDDVRAAEGSYPGYPLRLGDSGNAVLNLQKQLMRIRENYPAIPLIPTLDGNFGASTDAAVRAFQEIFNLNVDGIVGRATWYRISYIYAAVISLAELFGEGISDVFFGQIPDVTIGFGESGDYVLLLQLLLNYISYFYPTVPGVIRDGRFGRETLNSLTAFQNAFGLAPTGVATPEVWNRLFATVEDILRTTSNTLPEQGFPGRTLRRGDSNDSVRLMQTYLNTIATRYPNIPTLDADGVFGPATERAVTSFQRDFSIPVSGNIDAATWERIVQIYNFITLGQ